MEYQINNWYYFTWLSGDFIAEMHIHELDLCNWIAGSVPAAAVGVGGRMQRTEPEYGNIWDNMAIEYEYPGGLHCAHFGRQMQRTFSRRLVIAIGSEGTADLSTRTITGKNPWKYDGKDRPSTVLEHANLIASIRAGKPLNESRRIAESTLTCILGREACYTGQRIQWDALMKSDLDLSPPKYEPGPFPMRPVPVPGKPT
jgi:predicted dehydrogenase